MLVTGDAAVNAYPLRTASSAAVISGGGSGSNASRYAVAPDIELRSGREGHPSANCEIFDGTEIVKRTAPLASVSSLVMAHSGGSVSVDLRKSAVMPPRCRGATRTVKLSPGTISLRSAIALRRSPVTIVRASFILSRLRRTLAASDRSEEHT